MSRYLVTGAAGFIASRVSQFLMDAGHTVVGVDNLNDAYDVRMKDYRLQRLQKQELFNFVKMDISDKDAALALVDKGPYDGVINLAARAGVRQSVENPWVYVNTNVNGTLNMLEVAVRTGTKKFILASTSSIYGSNPPIPTPETASSDYPLQPYSATKKGAEALCHSYHYLHNLDVTIFRYFTVYGPAARPDMVMFRFCQWIAEGREVRVNGDGTQSRGFTYLDDIARGTILGLKPVGYEVINLGGHQVITINDLIHKVEDLVGKKANVIYQDRHPADVMENSANVDKARSMLGWEPQVSLEEGIPNLVNWYLSERSWVSQILTP
ncbi:NAD-dependent epimerase/dehydratase family protein [Leptolinea tardivitalis]|uniref:Nucleotide sugar epimerase n=1 Tax=Leptolinea tardivitalis TaxID=229920 RepID=A0A0P6X7U0_9CHLR|nr:NAD-dependent epimerase/dehydratase family protein [Leptolinea tardivitalis]KPL70245.1 nucleotide sugar epimerase [Leptolinea tardivitalis]GAP21793.1 nucleoside-diphosphate-sugar epimerase [Leptolinea tardivitalis]